jgi:CBS domain-containing protein
MGLLCEDLMKRAVFWLGEQDTAASAGKKMREKGVGFLPVCDARGKVLGAITDRDLAIRVCGANRPAGATPITEVMSAQPVTCRASDPIVYAEGLMVHHKKSRVMVTDDEGILTGVISLSDIADAAEPEEAQSTIRGVTHRKSAPRTH